MMEMLLKAPCISFSSCFELGLPNCKIASQYISKILTQCMFLKTATGIKSANGFNSGRSDSGTDKNNLTRPSTGTEIRQHSPRGGAPRFYW